MATLRRRLGRAIVVALALLGMGIGVAGVHQLAGAAGRDTDDIYTIDVGEAGFTPDTCDLNRNDSVRFRNAGTTARRVIVPGTGVNAPPDFDTGALKPGEVSNYYVFVFGGHFDFFDAADLSHKFTVSLPVHTVKQDEVCRGNPAAPTPTNVATPAATSSASPSPTVSPSATPSATVTPQVGVRCRGYAACVVTMAVASDR